MIGCDQAGTVEPYIAERIRRPAPRDCGIVPGTLPIVSFGDIRSAWVATLSINPSVGEYFENGREIDGRLRRFETMGSLGISSPEVMTDAMVARVIARCHGYFAPAANPYKFFRSLDGLLHDALGITYEGRQAAHLDLVQWATDPLWRALDPEVRARLLADDRDFLLQQLETEAVRLVLMNGAGVRRAVQSIGVGLEKVADLDHGKAPGELWGGSRGGTVFLGWNQFLPFGGMSRRRRDQVADHVRAAAVGLAPNSPRPSSDPVGSRHSTTMTGASDAT